MEPLDKKRKPPAKTNKTNSYCWISVTKGAQCAAAIQIIHGILYLLYSIISWTIDSFPRVRSGFETYYAFGQPVLTSLLGLSILISIIVVSDFNVKAIIFTCWTVIQLALIGLLVYRITSFYQDETYIKIFETHKSYMVADTIVSLLIIVVQCFEIIAIISYICEQANEEDALHENGDPSVVVVNDDDIIYVQGGPRTVPVGRNQPAVTYVYAPGYPPVYRRPYYDGSDLLVLGLLAGSTVPYGCYDDYCW